MINIKIKIFCALIFCGVSQTYADILIILPESGPMARAGESVKQGIIKARFDSNSKIPIRFVDSSKTSLKNIFKKNVNKKIELVIGPLALNEVEELMILKPKVPILALNQTNKNEANIYQFSLAKQQDANALAKVMIKDKIKKLLVYREESSKKETEQFLMALIAELPIKVEVLDQYPQKMKSKEGLLLLGHNNWLMQAVNFPKKNIYVQALTVDESALPVGVKYCDIPALYENVEKQKLKSYQDQETSSAYKRLIAFGHDSWKIAEFIMDKSKSHRIDFEGMTGHIVIEANQITRTPECYEQLKNVLRRF